MGISEYLVRKSACIRIQAVILLNGITITSCNMLEGYSAAQVIMSTVLSGNFINHLQYIVNDMAGIETENGLFKKVF